MPKDEFDFEDPFELNAMAFMTHEDTTDPMAECLIEEFMRMGYSHKQLLALFRNPHYVGPNMAYQKRGEPFIRDLIIEVFARWGRHADWHCASTEQEAVPVGSGAQTPDASTATPTASAPLDPMGAPAPQLNV